MFIGRLTRMFGVILIILSLLFIGCSRGVDVVPSGEAELVRYSHSDTCVSAPTHGPAEVEIIVDGLEISVLHKNAVLNCCLDSIIVEFTQEGTLLKLSEMEAVSNPCYCLCPFEVRATIRVPGPGTYVIEIWTENTKVWRGEVEIGGELTRGD